MELIAGANGNVTSQEPHSGWTPRNFLESNNSNLQIVWVIYSVKHSQLACTIAIVRAGADTNLQNEIGETAGDLRFF